MRHRKTENTAALLGGAVLGAAVMYLLDPEAGRRRREYLSDATGDAMRGTGAALGPVLSGLSERAQDWGHSLSERTRDAGSSIGSSVAGGASSVSSSVRDSDWLHSLGDFGTNLAGRARGIGRGVSDRARGAVYGYHEEEESHATAYTLGGIAAAALGAGALYMLDPKSGRQRRAAAGDQVMSVVNQTGRAFRQTGRYCQDLMNRGKGTAYEMRTRMAGGASATPSADSLLQRIRSELGHVTSHTGALQIMTDAGGSVTLNGRVLASEVDKVLSAVTAVPGVNQVINRLDVQDTVAGVGNPSTTTNTL